MVFLWQFWAVNKSFRSFQSNKFNFLSLSINDMYDLKISRIIKIGEPSFNKNLKPIQNNRKKQLNIKGDFKTVLFLINIGKDLIQMAKQPKKKAVGKSVRGQKKKLPRGYKECGNCSTLLNIHKYVCDKCGHKHDMKKKKVDILKNLNNLTPKLLRSLIELNDFNDITDFVKPSPQYRPSIFHKPQITIPQEMRKRKSSKSVSHSTTQTQSIHFVEERGFMYSKIGAYLTSICAVGSNMLVAESTEKWSDLTETQRTTIKAYGLQKYHKFGQIYNGKTILSLISHKKVLHKISVNQHILLLKSIGNKVAALTGKGTVIILNIETNHKENDLQSFEYRQTQEVKASSDDQITVMEWLRGMSSSEVGILLVGTIMGHLYVFQIADRTIKLLRFISNAHFQAVSALAECPLSNEEETIFASGSYDGSLVIWSINSKECLYRIQASNRKITSLLWDPGAKFIFVIRDENQDSGVLACFFAILKSEESVALSDQIDFRLVKCSPNCKILYNGYNEICLVDTYSLTVKIISTEELRKNSLKRKKVKRQDQERTYSINIPGSKKQTQNTEQKMTEKYLPLPLIADACIVNSDGDNELWGITYDGVLFVLQIK